MPVERSRLGIDIIRKGIEMTRVANFLLLTFVCLALVINTPCVGRTPLLKDYYKVALFEHARRGNLTTDTPAEIKETNLGFYRRAVEVASAQGADIIAFLEYGIAITHTRNETRPYLENVPDPKKGRFNPCEHASEYSNRPILYNMSCLAKENRMYIVVNMGDIQPCTKEEHEKCPDDGAFHLNANVVFDRDGTIISRYHKERLYFEKAMDLPVEPQDPFFTTDFGNFASFICFDALYKRLPLALRNESIDGVILSSLWMDDLPMLNSVQFWQALAIGTNSTYMAVNGQIPAHLAIGSGVFTSQLGALKYTFNPDGLSKLIVTRVPKNKHQSPPFSNPDSSITVITADGSVPYDIDVEEEAANVPEVCNYKSLPPVEDTHNDYRCMARTTTNYTLMQLTRSEDHVEACNEGLCCSLDYSAEEMNEPYYLGVFNGTHNSFNRYFWCEELCFVSRCDPFNGSECGTFPAKSKTLFRKLHLKANFSSNFVYPSVMNSGMRLQPKNEWSYDIAENAENKDSYDAHLTFEYSGSKSMLVAALYSRCYDRDPPYVR